MERGVVPAPDDMPVPFRDATRHEPGRHSQHHPHPVLGATHHAADLVQIIVSGTLLYQLTGSAATQQHSMILRLSDGKGEMTATTAHIHPTDVRKHFAEAHETAKQQLPRGAAV